MPEFTQPIERVPKFHKQIDQLIVILWLNFSLFLFCHSIFLPKISGPWLDVFFQIHFLFPALSFEMIDAIDQNFSKILWVVLNFQKFDESQ